MSRERREQIVAVLWLWTAFILIGACVGVMIRHGG